MLNKGRHGREQVLARATVELMTSDQLTPEQRAGSEIFFGAHSSRASAYRAARRGFTPFSALH
jgi:hypothetical protein